jgi:hypothetical protein
MDFKYDPSLDLLNFDAEVGPYDPQHFKSQLESETGRRIFEVVTSRDGKLVAALATRRRDPVVPDLEPFIAAAADPEAFQDRFKQFTGHLVKHVVQCMGGEIERRDVDVTIPDSHYTRATRYRRSITITLICHSNGQFSVGKNMGGFNGSMVFKTREEADAYAIQLQAQAGGPDKARIIVHDLFKTEAERSAARLLTPPPPTKRGLGVR